MPPPTTSVSTLVARTLSTSSLSATLAPPTTATNGRAGAPRMPAEHLDLLGEAQTGRAGQEVRWPDDGRVGPVRGAERLVHVGVVALDQPLHEGRVVRLLARVEAQVLGQRDAGAQGRQPLAHRVHLPARVRRPGRAAEMRRRRHHGPLVVQPPQGRHRSA